MKRCAPFCEQRDQRSAFSATDLLVIVAVLSLLGALGSIWIAGARQKSRQQQCLGNLGKINQAILSFANDHTEQLPAPNAEFPANIWWFYKEQVKTYAHLSGESSTNDTVFACPSDRGYSEPGPFWRSSRFDFSSYVFNGVTLAGVPNIAGWQTSAVREPKKTLLAMEWTAHAPLSWHRSRTGKKNMPFYSDAESVVGFVDGHVRLTKIYYDGYNAAYTRDPIEPYDYKYSGD